MSTLRIRFGRMEVIHAAVRIQRWWRALRRLWASNVQDPITLEELIPRRPRRYFCHVLPNGLVHHYNREQLSRYFTTSGIVCPIAPLSQLSLTHLELKRLSPSLVASKEVKILENLLVIFEHILPGPMEWEMVECCLMPMFWSSVLGLMTQGSADAVRVLRRSLTVFHRMLSNLEETRITILSILLCIAESYETSSRHQEQDHGQGQPCAPGRVI